MLSIHARYEPIVALLVTLVIAVFHLVANVAVLALSDAFDLANHAVFQVLFGMISKLLITLEFKHSILRIAVRQDSVIQVKTVRLIALLALTRKFIILDASQRSTGKIITLAAALPVLGVVHWLMPERDDRIDAVDEGAQRRVGGSAVNAPGPLRSARERAR